MCNCASNVVLLLGGAFSGYLRCIKAVSFAHEGQKGIKIMVLVCGFIFTAAGYGLLKNAAFKRGFQVKITSSRSFALLARPVPKSSLGKLS